MKRLAAFVLLLAFPFVGSAAVLNSQCDLYWDYVPLEEAPPTGFKLYNDGALLFTLDDPAARSVSCGVAGMTPGNYNLTITAFNAELESEPSDPLAVTVVTFPAPTKLRLTITFE